MITTNMESLLLSGWKQRSCKKKRNMEAELVSDFVYCAILGDKGVGKTSFVVRYFTHCFPDTPPSEDADYDSVVLKMDKKKRVRVGLMDMPDKEVLRQQVYSDKITCVLLFAAVDDPDSFEHIISDWIQEAKRYLPHVRAFLLVGTKQDLREKEKKKKGKKDAGDEEKPKYVTKQRGKEIAMENGIIKYVECSSLIDEGVNEVVKEAAKIGLTHPPHRERATVSYGPPPIVPSCILI